MSSPRGVTPERLALAARAREIRDGGALIQDIAAELGVSRSYASELLHDPDGSRARARKDSYAGVCEDCGGPTSGCNGRANAPRLCGVCAAARQRGPDHGIPARYNEGCRCAECKRAAAERARRWWYRSGRVATPSGLPYRPLTGFCRGCGVPYDQRTRGCQTCNNRHFNRKYLRRRHDKVIGLTQPDSPQGRSS